MCIFDAVIRKSLAFTGLLPKSAAKLVHAVTPVIRVMLPLASLALASDCQLRQHYPVSFNVVANLKSRHLHPASWPACGSISVSVFIEAKLRHKSTFMASTPPFVDATSPVAVCRRSQSQHIVHRIPPAFPPARFRCCILRGS